MTTQTVITAPVCPTWCTTDHGVSGWDEVGPNTTKRCQHILPSGDDIEGTAVDVEVTRFADIDDGLMTVYDVFIEVGCDGKLTAETARLVAAALIKAADLVA